MGDELGDHFRVGVAMESNALALELPLERGEVFDDAVVNDGHQAVAADVGVSVEVVGWAVRGPACVADPGRAGGRMIAQIAREILNAS
jgi:hypothetical protein